MSDQKTIELPYDGGVLSFVRPAKAGMFNDTMKALDNDGLFRPTSAQILALLSESILNPDMELKKPFEEMPNLWTSTEYLLVPEEGIFIYDNPEGDISYRGITREADVQELAIRLSRGDSSVRFVQYGFKTGNQSVSEFLKNPLVVAHFGENSLGNLEKVITGLGNQNPILTAHNKPIEYRGEKPDIHAGTLIGFAWGQEGFNLINDPLVTIRNKYGASFGIKKR